MTLSQRLKYNVCIKKIAILTHDERFSLRKLLDNVSNGARVKEKTFGHLQCHLNKPNHKFNN